MSAPYLDLAQAVRFLSILAKGEPVTFQTFSDKDELKVKRPGKKVYDPNARIVHGTLEQHNTLLERLNTKGAGVYLMVNAGDGKGRTAKNVQRIRAVFIDTDGAPYPADLPLDPHLVVQSSHGRWHLYWLVDGVLPESFMTLQESLAEHYGTDPSIKDSPRVMRLPGFYHCKGEPVRVELLQANDAPPYSPLDIFSAWPFLTEKLAAERAAQLERERRRAELLAEARERRSLPKVDDNPERKRALAILDGHFDRVARAQGGTKHNTLRSSARTLGGYVASGYLDVQEVTEKLRDAAKVGDYSASKAADAITWGLARGQDDPLKLEESAAKITFARSPERPKSRSSRVHNRMRGWGRGRA